MQKNQSEILPHSICKNYIKTDERPRYKIHKYKIPRRKHVSLHYFALDIFFDTTLKA